MKLRSAPPIGFWRRLGRALSRPFRGTSRRRSYDAAKTSRLRPDWTRSSRGPNAINQADARTLRARARDLSRNDAHVARAIEILAGNIVGTGILPRAIDDRESRRSGTLQRKADAAWIEAQRAVDVEGQHTLDALVSQGVRAWIDSGESLFRRRFDASSPVGIRLELLEADMLDDTREGPLDDGGRIVQGVEFGPDGRRRAYWFHQNHPGEDGLYGVGGSLTSVRVPATDVIHLYLPLRPRQVRGLPFGAPIMAMKRDLGEFEAFELIRKKTEALVVAMVSPGDREDMVPPAADEDDEEGESSIVPTAVDADGNLVGDLRPGAVLGLENGKSVTFNSPQISGNYDVYKRAMLQSIAVGFQLTYELLTGDLSGVNYSSYRAGHLQFNAYIDRMQWLYLIPVVMDRLWDWVMGGAFLMGKLPRPDVPREWAPPRRLSLDPEKDAVADILEVRAGLALLDDKQAERGYQPAKLRQHMADTKAALDLLGLVLDSDPTKMAFRGAFPPAAKGTAIAASVEGSTGETTAEEVRALARARVRAAVLLLGDLAPLNGDGSGAGERAA